MKMVRTIKKIGVLLCMVFAAGPAAAQNWNQGPKPDEYIEFITKMKVGGNGPLDAQFWFQAGMMVGLQAAKEDYAGAGIAPLYCLPTDLQPVDLRDQILAELKANPDAWRALHAGVEKTAVYVVRRKYPC